MWIDISPKKTSRWPTDTWKNAPHHSSSGKCKQLRQKQIWRGCRERGSLFHCWWECKLVQPLWKTVWRFLKKLKIELSYDPAIALLGIYPQDTSVLFLRDTCTHPHVYSSTINNIQSMERAQMSINGWMDKEDVVYIHKMEYYSATKKNEILTFATTWMELEGIMLSEINQRKTNIIWLHSYEDFKRQNRRDS